MSKEIWRASCEECRAVVGATVDSVRRDDDDGTSRFKLTCGRCGKVGVYVRPPLQTPDAKPVPKSRAVRAARGCLTIVVAWFVFSLLLNLTCSFARTARDAVNYDPTPSNATPARDESPVINGQRMLNEFYDNPYTAGQKYDGKRVRLTVTILQIKVVKGRMQLWNCALPNGTLPLIVFDTKADPGPGAKTIKAFEMATIEGTCRGRVDDGLYRVPAPGWTFQINVTDCTVLQSGKDLPIVNP